MNSQSIPAPASRDACDDVGGRIRAGQALDTNLVSHCGQCSACASLVAFAGDGVLADELRDVGPAAPGELAGFEADFESLRDSVADERGIRAGLSQQPTRIRVGLAVAGALLMPLFWLVSSPRADFDVYPSGRLVRDLALFVVPVALMLPLLLRPLHRRVEPGWVRPLLVLVSVVAMIVIAASPVAHWDHPASQFGTGEDLSRRAIGCFLTGLISALPIVLWTRMLSRRSGSLWQVGALGAIAAAVVGSLAVFLHCPLTSPLHLTLGHVTVLLPFVGLGLLGRGRS